MVQYSYLLSTIGETSHVARSSVAEPHGAHMGGYFCKTLTSAARYATLLPTSDSFEGGAHMTAAFPTTPHTSGVTNTGERAPCNQA